MLRNYIKIAWRNLLREKGYSFINIFGLAVGLACCLMIARYAEHELSYDRFHTNADRLYRAVYVHETPNGVTRLAQTPVPLAGILRDNLPEVEAVAQIHKQEAVLERGNELFEQNVLYADSSFLNLFSFPIVQGQTSGVLEQPGNLLLSESAAEKYFPGKNPVGEPIRLRIQGAFHDFTVAAVVQDPPSNSSIRYEVIVPFKRFASIYGLRKRSNNWGTLMPRTYLLMRPGVAESEAEEKTANYLAESTDLGNIRFDFQPITQVHLSTGVQAGLEPPSNPNYSYILIGIALFILMIACINFTTLAVGRSARRASEIGMRKALGARRSQLIRQFLGETVLIVTLAVLLALFLVEWTLPYFSILVDKELTFSLVSDPDFLTVLFGSVILVVLIGGGYPALYLSRFRPAEVLKGRWSTGGKSYLTYGLVTVQFCLSVILIVTTILMNRQMELIMNSELGFNTEQVVRLEVPYRDGEQVLDRLKTTLANYSSVQSVSGSWQQLPSEPGISDGTPTTFGEQEIRGYSLEADPGLVKTMELEIVQGKDFSHVNPDDPPNEVIVNETLVDAFGWEDPIGKKISMVFTFQDAEVIGVVEDFHYHSLHEPIMPLAIYPDPSYIRNIFVRLASSDIAGSLQFIEEQWAKAAPGLPFQFSFMDDEVARQYRNDRRWQTIVQYASALAILIACLGLFGLATLTSSRRTNEIGIRKVLGATVPGIVRLLSKDFLKPVILGFLVAVPLSYYVVGRWLQTFAYRTDLDLFLFILAGTITAVIALATVSWQSIRAALANPAESLRTE